MSINLGSPIQPLGSCGYEYPTPSLKCSIRVKVEHAIPFAFLKNGFIKNRRIKLKIITKKLQINEKRNQVFLHVLELGEAILKRQQLQQQHEQYEIHKKINIKSKTKNTKKIAILE